MLGHENGVTILGRTGVDGDKATGCNDAIQGATINDQVFDDGEALRAERLDNDGVAIFEPAHMQLAQGGLFIRTVCGTVNNRTTHTADTLAAVMVKSNRAPDL